MRSNREIVKDATIETSSLTNGLLNPEQARKFIQQTFEKTTLSSLVRHEMRTAKTGEVDKIGIGKRILRAKTENYDDGYRAGVKTDAITYATTAVRLPWEITEETLRENIEQQNFETIVTDMMATQTGIDMEDLCLNGDVDTPETDEDYDFLKINDGWIKQIENAGHVVDYSNASEMSLDMFYEALRAIPNKYNDGSLRWIMSPHRAQEWELFLLNKVIGQGGAVPDSVYSSPANIKAIECPGLDDEHIILVNPMNLIVVNTYDVKIRKTMEGKEAIMMDKRFYVIHLDFDPIIEEADACGIINLAALSSGGSTGSGTGDGGDTGDTGNDEP